MRKILYLVLLLTVAIAEAKSVKPPYPNFDDNPFLSQEAKNRIRPHLIPLEDPIKPLLDAIFTASRVTLNDVSLADAGFEVLFSQPTSLIKVARHPSFPGYLFKLYLDTEVRQKENIPGWIWLLHRCEGAANIRALIKKKKIVYFKVPGKWLYPLPTNSSPPESPDYVRHPIVLIVEDMHIKGPDASMKAWRTKITEKHLDELFLIISNGYSSSWLEMNIPYIGNRMFACIDTEHPQRTPRYGMIRKYLSTHMRHYWTQKVQDK